MATKIDKVVSATEGYTKSGVPFGPIGKKNFAKAAKLMRAVKTLIQLSRIPTK